MTLVIPPGFANAAFRYSLTGDPEVMVTTCGFVLDGDPADLANGLVVGHNAEFAAGTISADWTFLGVHLAVGQDGAPPVTVEANVPRAGSGGAQNIPNNCAYLLRKLTGFGGRTGRGRMYIPPFFASEADISRTGMVTEPTRTNMENNWRNVLALELQPVLFHDDAGAGPFVPTPITQFVMDARIATQRRRMRR